MIEANVIRTVDKADIGALRMLVVIARFGQKNIGLLKRVIDQYRRMPLKVDVVVVSNDHKELGADVRVVVGLPTKNPWSLPFAHKAIFVENLDFAARG
jgi:hypothetical protein